MRTMSCVCLCLGGLCVGVIRGETPGQAIERQAIEYRREHLMHGRVELTVRKVVPPERPESTFDNGRYVIEFQPGYIRRDYTPANYPIGPLTTIITPEETIHRDTDDIRILDTPHVTKGFTAQVFDPALLGATIGEVAVLHNWTLESRLASPDRLNETVTDENMDGVVVQRISYDRSVGSHIELWVAPAQGFAIVKTTARGRGGEEARMTATSEQFPPGVWFPRVTEYVRLAADGRVTEHEIATVESADFTRPPDETRFSLLTMDVPAGTVIPDTGVEKVWNGRELEIRQEVRERAAQAVQTAVSPRRNYALWAIMLGLAAVLLAAWRMRSGG